MFAVLEDNDAEKLKALGFGGDEGLSDAEIEKLVRNARRRGSGGTLRLRIASEKSSPTVV